VTIGFVVTIAVFLGLLYFLLQEIRRPVQDSKWDHRPRLRKRLRILFIIVILFAAGLATWAFFIEPNRLVTHYETLRIERWPAELSDLKIAVLADIHAGGSFINERKLRVIVERTNELHPDLIVILGDFISGGRDHHAMDPEVFAPILKDFHAPLGVYSVLGNHDWWFDGERVRAALEANGIRVLENDVVPIEARGKSFRLLGLPDLWTRTSRIHPALENVPEGDPIIALAHNPDIFPQLPVHVPLLLAAHTHGGQVRLPIIGTVVHTSNFGDRYEAGHVFENGHHLFVTTGIGTSIIPVRFGVPPEIVLLTIKS
jgi:uncharacterized protein